MTMLALPERALLEAQQGLTAAELLRGLGLAAALTALLLLVVVEFVCRPRLRLGTYHWLLLYGLFVLPTVAVLGTTAMVLEETKKVESCATCHVMHAFVNDLRNPASETLAARHFRNKWIPREQCYTCHTTYGAHGTFQAKRDGLRHWWLYVTKSWKEPVRYKGTYPNGNCLACHGATPKFDGEATHEAIAAELASNETSCVTCHGPVHPEPEQRHSGEVRK